MNSLVRFEASFDIEAAVLILLQLASLWLILGLRASAIGSEAAIMTPKRTKRLRAGSQTGDLTSMNGPLCDGPKEVSRAEFRLLQARR